MVRAYDGVQAQEAGYRENLHTRDASLLDTLNACLGVTGTRVKTAPDTIFPDTPLLLDGFRRLRGHLTQKKPDDNALRRIAARAGVLAAHLRSGRPLDFAAVRYTQSEAQVQALRAASFAGTQHAWLDRIKDANAEAYHYWHLGLSV